MDLYTLTKLLVVVIVTMVFKSYLYCCQRTKSTLYARTSSACPNPFLLLRCLEAGLDPIYVGIGVGVDKITCELLTHDNFTGNTNIYYIKRQYREIFDPPAGVKLVLLCYNSKETKREMYVPGTASVGNKFKFRIQRKTASTTPFHILLSGTGTHVLRAYFRTPPETWVLESWDTIFLYRINQLLGNIMWQEGIYYCIEFSITDTFIEIYVNDYLCFQYFHQLHYATIRTFVFYQYMYGDEPGMLEELRIDL